MQIELDEKELLHLIAALNYLECAIIHVLPEATAKRFDCTKLRTKLEAALLKD